MIIRIKAKSPEDFDVELEVPLIGDADVEKTLADLRAFLTEGGYKPVFQRKGNWGGKKEDDGSPKSWVTYNPDTLMLEINPPWKGRGETKEDRIASQREYVDGVLAGITRHTGVAFGKAQPVEQPNGKTAWLYFMGGGPDKFREALACLPEDEYPRLRPLVDLLEGDA